MMEVVPKYSEKGEMVDLSHTAAEIELLPADPVEQLVCTVKKVTTTDDGKVAISLETMNLSDEAMEQIKHMIVLQQASQVLVSMKQVQGDLFER